MTDLVQTHRFSIRQMDDAYSLAQILSEYFPDPDKFLTAIYELLLNAVEHGNLGIGYELKTKLIHKGRWQEEVVRRQSLPEHAAKKVEIELTHNSEECQIIITDEGRGFAWQDFVGPPKNDRLPNGRGLLIAHDAPFESIAFNAAGNAVTCTARYRR